MDIYFYGEPNKEERLSALAELYLIVDEKANEYELTDKGIHYWVESQAGAIESDFIDARSRT